MENSDITRIRRFFRAVTTEVGALDASFLGRGRPLGTARVLHAVGHYGGDVLEIRHHLKLDKAILSRLLKGLEKEGLLTLAADPQDGRRRIAKLTTAGQAEWKAYDQLSDMQATNLAERTRSKDDLLAAMDLVASVFARERIALVECNPQDPHALWCLENYYAELSRRFEKGFDVNLSNDPEAQAMLAPRGVFYVLLSDGVPLGCCGLKGHGDWGEIKRLWISQAARGLGLAQKLLDACETVAGKRGMKVMRLDTNSALPEAERLYRKLGWTQIERFNDDPYPDLFFEKRVKA